MIDPKLFPVDRLRVCAVLAVSHAFEGQYQMRLQALGDAVDLAGADLDAVLQPLEDAGYLCRHRDVAASRRGGSTQEWLSLTQAGEDAFEQQLEELQSLAADGNAAIPAYAPATTSTATPTHPLSAPFIEIGSICH